MSKKLNLFKSNNHIRIFFIEFNSCIHWYRQIDIRERIVQASLFKFTELVLILGSLLYVSNEHGVWIHSRALESQLFDEARFSLAPFETNASLWRGNWSSQVDEPRPMELRPFWRWQRAVWFLWDEFPSPVTVPALSLAFVPSSFLPVVEIANLKVQRDQHACVRACARKCAESHTNAALNAVPRPRRWYHSTRRMVSFAPLSA